MNTSKCKILLVEALMDAFDDVFDNIDELMMEELLRAENEPPRDDVQPADQSAPADNVQPLPAINILDDAARARFIQDVLDVGYSSEWFTKPLVPTVTLDGTSTEIQFHEEQLISHLEATPQIIMFTCNFGKVIYPGYTPPTPVKKRKKIVARRRKVQGDGSAFNSQISCFISRIDYTQPWMDEDGILHQPKMTPDGLYYVIPTNAPRFEYKIFRNGRLQLPGATLMTFDEGIAGAKLVQRTIWEAIGKCNAEPVVVSMSSVMINFKFLVRLRPRHIIDLRSLRFVLEREKGHKTDGVLVGLVTYSRQKTNLSVEILVDGNPGITRVNIYLRGRVNIIGVKNPSVAAKVFDFLHMIFLTTNDPPLTRREGGIQYIPMINNVSAHCDPREYANRIAAQPVAQLSDADAAGINDLVVELNREFENEMVEFCALVSH